MAELIAHEIEIGAAVQRRRRQTRELVERHGAINLETVLVLAHAPVDRRIRHREEERLAADERLVVALDVTDDLLFGALVR